MERKFESKPRKFVNVTYSGINIDSDNRCLHAEMNAYIDKIELLHGDKIPYNRFTRLRAKLLCVSTVRSDILCAVLATQVTPDLYTQNEITKLNNVFEHAKNNKELQLSYPPLNKDSLCIVVHSDASFAGNSDMSTQVRYIILLADKHNTCHII
jgi:hypothetical protein